jgi:hypothetical protein
MQSYSVEQRLRRFLLGVTAAIFVGAIFELILVEHTNETQQWLPFIFSGLGLGSVACAWFNPSKATLQTLWWVMAAIALGSLYGVYLHFSGNLAFTREINPSYSLAQSIWPAIKGSNPLLAPGVFFLAGVLGMAATYRHPKL